MVVGSNANGVSDWWWWKNSGKAAGGEAVGGDAFQITYGFQLEEMVE